MGRYLWFENLGYLSILLKIWKTSGLFFLISGTTFFIFTYINILIAQKLSPPSELRYLFEYINKNVWDISDENLWEIPNVNLFSKGINKIIFYSILVLSFFVGIASIKNWQTFLLYFYSTPFNIKDSVFNKDIGFYIFNLPFLQYIYAWCLGLLTFTFIVSLTIYLLYGKIRVNISGQRNFFFIDNAPKIHLLILLSLVLFVFSFKYLIGQYNLLYSQRGVVFGTCYTDIYAVLPLYKIMFWICIICGILFLLNIFVKTFKFIFVLIIAFFISLLRVILIILKLL